MDPGARAARGAAHDRSSGARCRLLVGLALVGLAGAAFPSLALALALERGPYLQLGTPTSVVVRWRTDTPSSSQLRYGPAPDRLDKVLEIGGSRTEHEIEVTGLTPGSVYFYAVGSANQTLAGGDADHYFRTSPPPGSAAPFRIWVIGDSGKANQAAQDVRDAYLGFAAAHQAELWLMLGDNAYDSGTDAEYTAAVFQMYPQVLRNTVLWPSPGNHEFPESNSATQAGPYYEAFTLPTAGEAGGVPSGTEAYYSFDYGNVHFVALDSDDTSRDVGDPMYSWLELDLQANDKDFTIVYWHHPPYSKGYHDSDTGGTQTDMRENFVPLLEDYGVDLQLTGHSHSFERSMLVDGHYGVSSTFDSSNIVDGGDGDPEGDGGYHKPSVGPAAHEGAVYSVVGSSSDTDDGPLDHPIMVRSISSIEGSMVIEVEGRTLRAWWVDRTGVTHDHFEISKGPLLPACSDGLDNDGDGLSDHPTDPGCAAVDDDSELAPELICDDGIDNDGDGSTDHAQDPGCSDPTDASEQSASLVCDDGIDNDADQRTDLADPGCEDLLDGSELNPLTACTDLTDNDGDGSTDFESDPGCADALDDSELDPSVECDDGVDNDADQLVDLADPECADSTGSSESAVPIQVAVRVAASADDAEEAVSDGDISLTSSDLEMVLESEVQRIGMRFANLDIPQGADVLSAAVQFTVDETDAGPVSLVIEGELRGDAAPFSSTDFDVSDRPTTAAAVGWIPPEWPTVGASGPGQRTPDLEPILQEIVNREDWAAGNALVLIVSGTGNARTAESYDGSPNTAPLLEVVYRGAPPSGQKDLGVAIAGSGTVDLDPPGGSYATGTTVTLTGHPAPGFVFSGWSGDLSGSANPATLVMDADKSVTASFVPQQFTLGVATSGPGSVALSPPGGTYGAGTSVTLSAVPEAGFEFAGWSGDLSGNANPATLVMDADKSVTASFVAPQYTLTVTVEGSGKVVLSPSAETYPAGTLVELRARPPKRFTGWSGDLGGTSPDATIVMDGDKDVTASF